MAIPVTVLGILIAALGLVGLVNPGRLMGWIGSIPSRPRFFLAVFLRAVLGIYLLIAATSCRLPVVVIVVGILSLAAAVSLVMLGVEKMDRLVGWWLSRPAWIVRLWAIVAVAFGGLLVYAGA